MGHQVTEEYFSGQGVVLVAARDVNGNPKGFRPVGNVPNLAIKNATTVLEHKESTTGARGTDKRLTTEVKVSLEVTMENFNSENLALATRGDTTTIAAGSVTDEAIKAYIGAVTPLENIKVSTLVVEEGATVLNEYVDDVTPWDYKADLEAGSIKLNDGLVLEFADLGIGASAIAVGTTTTLTINNTAEAGGYAHLRGFTGADAANVNGKTFKIVSATSTQMVLDVDTTGDTITVGTNKVVYDGEAILATYNFAEQTETQAFTQGQPEMWLRFEGLNTAEDNSPVVVNVFKFALDPTQDLSLLSDTLQSFVLPGSVLKDSKRISGSSYYRVRKLNAG